MTTAEPPLVDLKVSNPVTYLRIWWKRVVGNEGMEFKFKIRPLTSIAIAIIVTTIALGVGRFVITNTAPFVKFETPSSEDLRVNNPESTPDTWRETGFTGTVHFSNVVSRYYLLTSTSAEAIILDVPSSINLSTVVGKRIFATGNYNKSTRILRVSDATDLELLSKKPTPIPTASPTPTPLTPDNSVVEINTSN